MDKKIEKLIGLAGDTGKYQYLALSIAFLIWSISAFHSISVPILEQTSLVQVEGRNKTERLDYEICEKYLDKIKYIEQPKYSWVIQFKIECDKSKVGIIGSCNYAGFTLGSLLFPFISSLISHKYLILIAMLIYCLFIFLISIIENLYFIYFSLVVLGICTNLSNLSSITIVSESVSTKKRSVFSSIINVGFTFNALIFIPFYWTIEKWKIVFYCDIGISILVLIYEYLVLYNSPRLYINKGQPENALKILRGIAKINKKLGSFDQMINEEEYKSILYSEKNTLLDSIESKEEKKMGFCDLFKYPSIRYKFIIFSFMFFTTSSMYNGISIGAKNMPGNIFLNMIILYIFEGLAYVLTGFFINIKKIGRKGGLLIFFIASVIAFAVAGALKNIEDQEKIKVPVYIISFLLRFTICGIYTSYYTYFIESYPTQVRSLGFGLNSTCGNIGGIIIPMGIELITNQQIVNYIFCGMCIIDIILICFLEETVGKPMRETIKELEENNKDNENKELLLSKENCDEK